MKLENKVEGVDNEENSSKTPMLVGGELFKSTMRSGFIKLFCSPLQ